MKRHIIVIGGPTATGKTALSVAVAKVIGGEIVSADSMQIYRRMNVGTAKVMPDEMEGITHHLIDVVEPNEPFSVAQYQQMALCAIDDICKRGKTPIIVGGTGLYVNSILFPMQFREFDPTVRQKVQEMYAQHGAQYMYDLLLSREPHTAKRLFPNDVKRVSRALELSFEGLSHSSGDLKEEPRFDYDMYVLSGDRAGIYARIDKRVDRMMDMGLLAEVKGLLAEGVSPTAQSFQAIAYKEMCLYLEGSLTLDETIALIKKRSRNYAKRQITWFKQYTDAVWLDYADHDNVKRILNDER